MPRLIDHPRASFKNGQEVASAVDYLGGSCNLTSCAERMGKKVSGAFKALISAGVKHGFVTLKSDILSTTDLYRTLKLAYNEDEKIETLRKAFLYPPLYQKIYDRFKGKDLPIGMLPKLLVREFGVEDVYGSRVSGYFTEGAKNVRMLENGKLIDNIKTIPLEIKEENSDEVNQNNGNGKNNKYQRNNEKLEAPFVDLPLNIEGDSFIITISGPGMNSKIAINENDDLLILEAMLNKIKKKLKEGNK